MATDKRFAVAGVSTVDGDTKVRFANDMMRIKILQKNGHTDINLVELPSEMTKSEAIAYLRSIAFGQGNAVVEAALAHVEKKNPAATSKPTKATKAASAKVAVTSDEDAPF
jgi:hypothetical protein